MSTSIGLLGSGQQRTGGSFFSAPSANRWAEEVDSDSDNEDDDDEEDDSGDSDSNLNDDESVHAERKDDFDPPSQAAPQKKNEKKPRQPRKNNDYAKQMTQPSEPDYAVGHVFHVNQDQVKNTPGLKTGWYYLTYVSPASALPKLWPTVVGESGRPEVDWQSIGKLSNNKQVALMATAAFLGATEEERAAKQTQLDADKRQFDTVPLEWVNKLETFVLPPKTIIRSPVFITLENAKIMEKWNEKKPSRDNKRLKLAMEASPRNVHDNSWRLVFTPSLFNEYLEVEKRKREKKRKEPSAPIRVKTQEQLLEEKLDLIRQTHDDAPIEFMRQRSDIIHMLATTAEHELRNADNLSTLNEFVKNTWEDLSKLRKKAKARCPDDFVKGYIEEMKTQSTEMNNSMAIFQLTASVFVPEVTIALADTYKRILDESKPITADKNVYQPSTKKHRST